MANEAVIVNAPEKIYQFTVLSGTNVTKGALMVISGARVATTSCNSIGGLFCGIATTDKDGTDYSTTLGVAQDGIYSIKTVLNAGAEGLIQVGDFVVLSGINTIKCITNDALLGVSGCHIVGLALQTATADSSIEVDIGRRI